MLRFIKILIPILFLASCGLKPSIEDPKLSDRVFSLEEFFDVLKLGLEHSGAVKDDKQLRPTQREITQMHREFIENDYNYSHINIGYIQNLPFARTESLLHFFKNGGEILKEGDLVEENKSNNDKF